ncbi:ketoacyl-ACP synthase III [Malikia spinosa]|uniref:ketoacyl-ACP synthase III n=1 Tax=Malikia spinosa TaxID=86180 RepID=UPI002FDB4A6F
MEHAYDTSGRRIHAHGAKVVGLVACVPATRVDNLSFTERFGESAVSDVVKMIGVKTRRVAEKGVTTRDLCRVAGEKLLGKLGWDRKTVDAVVFLSQTPDFILPATACALHADWQLPSSCIAFDINLGCSGYPYALWQAMMMIQTGAAKRVLLAVGDTISKIIDENDRSTAMLFGDAGTVTALEADENGFSTFLLGTDGAGVRNLIVPQGAFRSEERVDPRLEGKRSDCLYMDGGEIFNFTLKSVPILIANSLALAKLSVDDVDAFLLHQANFFMIKHLAKKSKVPSEKLPININEYGNTSSASIPLLMADLLADRLKSESLQLALFGFGVGYSWASAILKIGPLKCVEVIEL